MKVPVCCFVFHCFPYFHNKTQFSLRECRQHHGICRIHLPYIGMSPRSCNLIIKWGLKCTRAGNTQKLRSHVSKQKRVDQKGFHCRCPVLIFILKKKFWFQFKKCVGKSVPEKCDSDAEQVQWLWSVWWAEMNIKSNIEPSLSEIRNWHYIHLLIIFLTQKKFSVALG